MPLLPVHQTLGAVKKHAMPGGESPLIPGWGRIRLGLRLIPKPYIRAQGRHDDL